MTLAEIRAKVETGLGDVGAPASYTDANILAVVNEGLRLFALLTLCVERKVILAIAANAPTHQMLTSLPDWLLPLRVRCRVLAPGSSDSLWDKPLWDAALWDESFPDSAVTISPVRPTTAAGLAAISDSWKYDRSATVLRYACVGFDQFLIHPTPAADGTALEIVYAASPVPLALDTDVPEIAAEDHPALVHYAKATLPFAYGGSELQRGSEELLRFLAIAEHRGDQVRSRSRSMGYDRQPFELKHFDRSVLKALLRPKEQRRQAA